jgi:adenosylcobinamide-phosphate synthase
MGAIGALGLKLGGKRAYGAHEIAGATLGDGRLDATSDDIRRALKLYRVALAGLWLLAAAAWLL